MRNEKGQFVKGQPSPMKGIPSGRIPWNKGKRMTDEQRVKLDISGLQGGRGWNRGIPADKEHIRKMVEARSGMEVWNKGKTMSAEARRKMSERKIGKPSWNKGKKQPQTTGTNHYNWKGGVNEGVAKLRTTYEYKAWRLMVFHRDWFSCRFPGCSQVGKGLQAHHIIPVSENMDRIFDVNNGITLCKKHHDETRKKESDYIGIFFKVLSEEIPTARSNYGN